MIDPPDYSIPAWNTRRAIDIREGEVIDALAFNELVLAAAALNEAGGKAKRRTKAAV